MKKRAQAKTEQPIPEVKSADSGTSMGEVKTYRIDCRFVTKPRSAQEQIDALAKTLAEALSRKGVASFAGGVFIGFGTGGDGESHGFMASLSETSVGSALGLLRQGLKDIESVSIADVIDAKRKHDPQMYYAK